MTGTVDEGAARRRCGTRAAVAAIAERVGGAVARLRTWAARGVTRADLVVVTVTAASEAVLFALVAAVAGDFEATATVAVTGGALVVCLPLAWRRRAPVAVLLSVYGLIWVGLALLGVRGVTVTYPALYAAGRHRRPGIALPVAGTVLAADAVVNARSVFDLSGVALHRQALVSATVYTLLFVPALAAGAARRLVRARADERTERQQAELARQHQEALAVERARIARELQRLVTRSLATIAARAGAAHERFDQDHAAARTALADVQATGRETLTAMRRLLGMLRTPGDGYALSPLPSLHDVGELVAAARGRGVAVDYVVEGPPAALRDETGLAVYRMLSALLAHAADLGPVSPVRIVVAFDAAAVRVRIAMAAARGAEPVAAPVREWVRLAGGEFRTSGDAALVCEARFPTMAGGAAR